MHPKIQDYLRRNGAKYTTKSLRSQLLHAGYEATEVDSALHETEAARAPKLARTKGLRSQFWGLALVINLVVLLAVSALVGSNTYAGAVFVVLGIAMLIGLGISGSIGSSLLPGRGLLFALAVPVVAALLLGGACFAIMQPGSGSGMEPSTRYPGTLELRIDAPLAFNGSGAATCETLTDLFSVTANDLGSIAEMPVSVFMNGPGSPQVQPGDGERKVDVEVRISEANPKIGYVFGVPSMEGGLPMRPADGASGMIDLDGLLQQPTGASPLPGVDAISGTITWTCDLDSPYGNSNPPESSNG